eukprot:SAG22_NODE_196_length_15552_cov_971.604543_8_plen_103_part_00
MDPSTEVKQTRCYAFVSFDAEEPRIPPTPPHPSDLTTHSEHRERSVVEFFCSWMLTVASGDPSLPIKLKRVLLEADPDLVRFGGSCAWAVAVPLGRTIRATT